MGGIQKIHKLAALVCSVALGACQIESKTPDTSVNHPQPVMIEVEDPVLPLELSSKYRDAFDKYPERTAKRFLSEFDRISIFEPVTKDVLINYYKQDQAQLRAMVISELLSRDLNGNGVITKDELKWFSARSSRFGRGNYGLDTLSVDTNNDGELSLNEIISQSHLNTRNEQFQSLESPKTYFMVFDTNKDGLVSRDEITSALAPYLTESTSPESVPKGGSIENKLRKMRNQKSTDRKPPKLGKHCDLPPLKNSTEIVLLGGYESDTYSSVAVGGQDTAAYATHITVEPGKSDLYIIATSFMPMVWALEGDVKRVKSFVSQASTSGDAKAAIVGLNKKKIHYIERGCFPYRFEPGSKDELLANGKINSQLGRKSDHNTGQYKLGQISIPSGDIISAPSHNRRTVKPLADRNVGSYVVKNGVLQVALDDLVSQNSLEYFKVLPGQAGLRQLIAEGKVVPLKDRSYHIVKPIERFPARLTGGSSVTFVLGKGVPMPKGSPGHSKIYSEETGELIKKR